MESGRQRQQQHVLHQRMPAWYNRKGYRELIAKGKEFGDTVTPSRVDSTEGWRFQARIVVSFSVLPAYGAKAEEFTDGDRQPSRDPGGFGRAA